MLVSSCNICLNLLRERTDHDAAGRSRRLEGDASGSRGGDRQAAPDHQGTAAPPLRAPGRDVARRPASPGPRGGRAGRSGRPRNGRGRRSRQARGSRQEAARQPRLAAGPLAAHRARCRRGRQKLPLLPRRDARHGRGRVRASRRDPHPVPRHRHAPAEVCLPGLRGSGVASTGARPAGRGRHSHRGDCRPCAREQIRRPPAALPAGADLRSSGREPRPLHTRRLGWQGGLPASPRARAAVRKAEGLGQAVRR